MAEVKFAQDLRQMPEGTSLRSHQLRFDGLLVLVTMIWGSTFLVVKETLTLTGVLLAGDVLSLPAWIGCGCILLGMIVGVIRYPSLKLRKKRLSTDLLVE